MTRTDALKGAYVARIVLLLATVIGAEVLARRGAVAPATALGVLFVALLLSNRIQAHFWIELLAGLRALDQRDYAASKVHSERFLAQLRERPWLKRLIWLGPSSYALSAEALALNNLGAAEMGLGEFDAARARFDQAIALDPQGPLPYRNKGALILRTASSAEALPWLQKAEALGLREDFTDRWMMSSQWRNAKRLATDAGRRSPSEEPPVTGAFIVYALDAEKTPFEVAVAGLEEVFGMTGQQAIATALRVSQSGRAACAGFDDLEVARGRTQALEAFGHARGHVLPCVVEPGEVEAYSGDDEPRTET